MGVLAPLYLAGLAALAIPLIYHLVRRTPRGRQPFSSLMFLAPTPPRLTRRSRLDQIFLLLLRLGALALLALAFSRPFVRESTLLSMSDLPQRRVALLIDTSASMRRGDLWQQAIAQAERELDDLAPHDDVALFAYSDHLTTVASFAADQNLGSASAADAVRSRLRDLEPTWQRSDLGGALVTLARELDTTSDEQASLAEPQIILISDCQQGSDLGALEGLEWPPRVRLIVRPMRPSRSTNARCQLLVPSEDDVDQTPRVRVVSAADSTGDQFFVRWASAKDQDARDGEAAIYVPPGESRVIKLPRPEGNLQADRIVLRGDDHDFDNVYFVAPPQPQDVMLLYAGEDAADDPEGMRYYLNLATSGDSLRKVTVSTLDDDSIDQLTAVPAPKLVVCTRGATGALEAGLRSYAERGGLLVLAPRDDAAAKLASALIPDIALAESQPQETDSFALLGTIDFTHPLFAPFASPRYNDFTRIHFWQHRRFDVKSDAAAQVVARFDDGAPWMIDARLGEGRVLVLASGWHPEDSQLAVSSKFVPLIESLLTEAYGSTRPLRGIEIGETAPLPSAPETQSGVWTVHLPGGATQRLNRGEPFRPTAPGIYRVDAAGQELHFAVNLPGSESATAPLALEQLEQVGVKLASQPSRQERLDRMRQARATELEGRQKIWRWLLVGCLGLLVFETWWAGRAARLAAQPKEGLA